MKLKDSIIIEAKNAVEIYQDLREKAILEALYHDSFDDYWDEFDYAKGKAIKAGIDIKSPRFLKLARLLGIRYWSGYDSVVKWIDNAYTPYLNLMLVAGKIREAVVYDASIREWRDLYVDTKKQLHFNIDDYHTNYKTILLSYMFDNAILRVLFDNRVEEWDGFGEAARYADRLGIEASITDERFLIVLNEHGVSSWSRYEDVVADVVTWYAFYLRLMMKNSNPDDTITSILYDPETNWEKACWVLWKLYYKNYGVLVNSITSGVLFDFKLRLNDEFDDQINEFLDWVYTRDIHPEAFDAVNDGEDDCTETIDEGLSKFKREAYMSVLSTKIDSDWKKFLESRRSKNDNAPSPYCGSSMKF